MGIEKAPVGLSNDHSAINKPTVDDVGRQALCEREKRSDGTRNSANDAGSAAVVRFTLSQGRNGRTCTNGRKFRFVGLSILDGFVSSASLVLL